MSSSYVTRIPPDDLKGCQSWRLPEVSSSSILPSAEKEDKERKQTQDQQTIPPVDARKGESVEDIEQEAEAPITAEQLQAITETAEKEGFASGHKKGFEQGLAEGKAAGLKQAKSEVAAQVHQLQTVIDALMIPLEREQAHLEVMLIDTVCQLTQAVVTRELMTDSKEVLTLINEALTLLPRASERMELFLNPGDIALVKQHLQTPADVDCHFVPDPDLLPGGCRLESKDSAIDATVETRLQQLLDDFVNKRLTSEPAVSAIENSEVTAATSADAHVSNSTDSQDKTTDNSAEVSPK